MRRSAVVACISEDLRGFGNEYKSILSSNKRFFGLHHETGARVRAPSASEETQTRARPVPTKEQEAGREGGTQRREHLDEVFYDRRPGSAQVQGEGAGKGAEHKQDATILREDVQAVQRHRRLGANNEEVGASSPHHHERHHQG